MFTQLLCLIHALKLLIEIGNEDVKYMISYIGIFQNHPSPTCAQGLWEVDLSR